MSPVLHTRRPRGWSWLGATLVVAAVLLVTCLALAWTGLSHLGHAPLSVVIDGEPVFSGVDLTTLPPGRQAALVGGLTLAVLLVVVVVPLTLLAVAALVTTVVVLSLGLPLLLMAGLALLVLSPLWLMAVAVWWLWRRSSGSPRSATMAG